MNKELQNKMEIRKKINYKSKKGSRKHRRQEIKVDRKIQEGKNKLKGRKIQEGRNKLKGDRKIKDGRNTLKGDKNEGRNTKR
jgi:hypothetical protein